MSSHVTPTLGPGGPLTVDECQRRVAAGEVDTIVCAVPDSYGRLMGKRLTATAFQELCLDGDGVRASAYLFATDVEMEPLELPVADATNGYRDFRMVPDLATLRQIPWEPSAVMVICDAYQHAAGAGLLPVAPRSILKAQLGRAHRQGLGLRFASELEFYLGSARADRPGAGPELADLVMTSAHRMDYNLLQSAEDEWFVGLLRRGLDRFGVPIEASKTEWGLGQQEITMDHAAALEMADRHVLFKHSVKQLASACGLVASFMAKPRIDEVGSSCHIHVSLRSAAGDTPIDWAEGAPGNMSKEFAGFVAGQLACARELGLLWAPTINSYKRYTPDAFAGTTVAVGYDNRSCGFRLVGEGASFRVENRIPGADVNPYHAYAAIVAAGLAGIDSEMPTPPVYAGNAYADRTLPQVPTTMHESLALFSDSELARDAFRPEVHEHLAGFAAGELSRFEHGAVTDWETHRYFTRI